MGNVKVTPAQERLIRQARQQGAGYRTIAAAIGLDRDAVRYYCKRHGLDADLKAERGEANPNAPNAGCCPNCGGVVAQPRRGRPRKFCSDTCRRAWWSKHSQDTLRGDRALYSRSCRHCGKTFTAYGNDHRRYCSHACYIQARFGSAPARQVIHNLS